MIWHLEEIHSSDPDFTVTCGIDGCRNTYKLVGSFRNHVYRKHQRWISAVDNDPAPEASEELCDSNEASSLVDTVCADDEGATGPSHSPGLQCEPRSRYGASDEEPSDPLTLQCFTRDLLQSLAKMFFNISECRKLPYSVCDSLFQQVEFLVQSLLKRFGKCVKQALIGCGYALPENLTHVLDCNFLVGLFDDIRSRYQRSRYIKANFPFTEAQQRAYAGDDQASYQYVSVGSVIRQFVQCRNVFEHLISTEVVESGTLYTFQDGSVYKRQMSTVLHSKNVKVLHILLYMDEVEIANPIGPARGVHKLLAVYYTVLNVHPKYRSQLKFLHLAILAKYADVQRYGLETVLGPLLDELKELQEIGINVHIGQNEVCFKVFVLACCGDNLSMNRLGGFTCSFSRGSVCRFCMAQHANLASLTREELCHIRTQQLHDSHLTAIHLNPVLYKRLYGVNEPSPMSCLPNFDVTTQLPPDIMHDIFEGACSVVIKHVLKGLFQENVLVPSDLSKVGTFCYGRNDRPNKPPQLTEAFLQSNAPLKGTASQKWCLFRLLPQIFASKVPEGNKDWEVYLLFREVTDLLLSDQLPSDSLVYIEMKIQEFLRSFIDRYPTVRIIPKLHYLVHYPRMISFFGPLKQMWCMRFEAKHQYFKNVASKTKNYRNICKTLAERHQVLQGYEFAEVVLDQGHTMTGLKPVQRSDLPPCIEERLPPGSTWQAKSVTMQHITYHVGDVLVMAKGDDPQFAQIAAIFSGQSEVLFLLNPMELVEFRRHRYAFRVSKGSAVCAAMPGAEVLPECLDLYFGGEVVPRCELVLFN